MPIPSQLPHGLQPFAVAAPSPPLGPFVDSAVAWTTWVTLMGFVGLIALSLVSAGPAAGRIGSDPLAAVTARLSRVAVALGVLAVPAVLTDLAHGASDSGGYAYGAAWNSLYDGSNDGRLSGLELTFILAGAALLAPLTVRAVAAGPARRWLLGAGLAAGAVALGTTKFPDTVPDDWGRTVFETVHVDAAPAGRSLSGSAAWPACCCSPSPARSRPPTGARSGPPAIRRFSATAMSCVAAIALSGLFLYWEHVDGPIAADHHHVRARARREDPHLRHPAARSASSTSSGCTRAIEALRAAGDDRPLHTILLAEVPGRTSPSRSCSG